MVAPTQSKLSVEAFDELVDLPENADRVLEYIGGRIYEVPSNPYVSAIAIAIATFIKMYLLKNPIGYVTGEAGGYIVSGERYAPDVAYISRQKQPELPRKGYNPAPPDLAVEIISDPGNSDELNNLPIKVANYLSAGVIVWVVKPDLKEVNIYHPGEKVQTIGADGTLAGGDMLPGFTLKVADIFEQ